jgi:hypothetical protein
VEKAPVIMREYPPAIDPEPAHTVARSMCRAALSRTRAERGLRVSALYVPGPTLALHDVKQAWDSSTGVLPRTTSCALSAHLAPRPYP